jgi:flagellar hook-length control protein FliK
MQTNALPIQLNLNANAAPGAGASGRNGAANGSQFGAMLSSELAQRQAMLPQPAVLAPAPAPKAEAPRPQPAKPAQANAAKPAEHAPAPASQAHAANNADEAKEADGAATDEAADKADEAADPAAAMLALMASLQPHTADAANAKDANASAAAAYDALTGGGVRGKRGDAAQLAALQSAMKDAKGAAAEDGADVVFGKTFAAIGKPTNPALAAAGAAVGDDRGGADALANGNIAANAGDGGRLQSQLQLQAQLQGAPDGAKSAPLEAELALRAARETEQASPVAMQAAQLQPAMLEAAQAAAGAEGTLHARVGTDAWQNQVGQKVVWMVGSEEQTASLTLNPPDLGPMQVVLSVTGDQASVTFSANQEEVRQALENALPRLREMMSDNGIALGNATVNAGMPDGRQAQEQPARGSRWNGAGRERDGDVVTGEATVRPARSRAIGDNGMVDTFA